MTTKYKIIVGFVVMMVLMGGIAVLGYKDLGDASDRFVEYRRYARINVSLSDVMSNMNGAGTQAFVYLISRDDKALQASMEFMDALDKSIAAALEDTENKNTQATLDDLRKGGAEYKAGLAQLGAAVKEMQGQYVNVVTPNGMAMAALLHDLAVLARQFNNMQAIATVEEAWSQYGLMLSALGRFAYTRADVDIKAVQGRITNLRPILEKIGGLLNAPESKVMYAKLAEASRAMFAAVNDMEKNAVTSNQVIAGLGTTRGRITADLGKLNTDIDQEMRRVGTLTLEANEEGQNQLLMGSGAGVVIGALLAIFTILGIVRVLSDLSAYAGAIARGDFTRAVRTREKGEIGGMVEAMKNIPAVLERVIADISSGVTMLQAGHYRARLNPEDYHGSYSDLVNSVNSVAEAYTNVLDELPIPILTADKALAVNFANTAARDAVGGNIVESFGREGDAANVFGKHAMETNKNYSVETTITNNGTGMTLAVTAVPLYSAGQTVGFIEILTDLTEIRAQQALMLQVATEASEISNRVAAASEELAAQVEQVSRGAEVQRERVDSTASAMTEMNATVIEVAKSAGEAAEQSDGTRTKAQEGAELVNQVMMAINSVNAVGQNLQVNMQELGNQAESIGNVMNVISDIADQTNLLALNAAIEAARAGEAGRGFAVVADEVRKLAEKTMEATQEVGSSISAVQQSARINIDEVGKAVASVAEANTLANSSGEALNEIVSLAAANSSVVASIATAAEQQSATSEEISRAIDEINQVVGETTEGMVQSSAAVQDLSRMAQELRRVMEGLR
ncbi:methyl-accepting chemotaxis protein [Desulfovibrio sp. OttesenSCG-928-O18]|nr:methyl-accepting chemotaxis protein [Desulfovibrio sp. OttesenSCG-928-O18]